MQLIKVTLKNFKTHKLLEFKISPGIVGVMGHNGAGKSSFLEGIYFGLTGKTLNGEPRSDLKTWGETDEGFVELIFGHNKKVYALNRSISKNTAHITNISDNTKIIGITEVAEFLKNTIGIDYDIVRQVLFVAQEQMDTPLRGTESSRKDSFGKLFGCNVLEDLRDKLQAFSSDIPVNKLLTQASLDVLRDEIKVTKDNIDTIETKIKGIETKLKELPDIMAIRDILVKRTTENIEQECEVFRQRAEEYQKIADECLGLLPENIDIEALRKDKLDAEAKLKTVLTGICPTCKTVLKASPYNKDELIAMIQKIDRDIQLYDKACKAIFDAEDALKSCAIFEESKKNTVSKKRQEEAKSLYNEIISLQDVLASYKETRKGYEYLFTERTKRIAELEVQVKENEHKLKFVDRINKIRAAFHRDAVQKDLRTFGAAAINTCLTECLSVFNVPYSVYFTQDGLAKFTDKQNHEHDFMSLSGGQKKIVSLAYRLALMRIFSNNINICVLDEPTSFIDTANIEAMKNAFVSLSEFAQQHNMTIFIATHEYSLVPIFDSLIELDK